MLSFISSSAVEACIPWINILLGQAILCIKISEPPGRGVQSVKTRGTGKAFCSSYLIRRHSRFISGFYFFLQKGQSHRVFSPQGKTAVELVCCTLLLWLVSLLLLVVTFFQTCLRFWRGTLISWGRAYSFSVSIGAGEGNQTKSIKYLLISVVLSKTCFEYQEQYCCTRQEHYLDNMACFSAGLPCPYGWLILKQRYSCMGSVALLVQLWWEL